MAAALRRRVLKIFNVNSLPLQPKACQYLQDFLLEKNVIDSEINSTCEFIIKACKRQKMATPLSATDAETVVKELLAGVDDDEDDGEDDEAMEPPPQPLEDYPLPNDLLDENLDRRLRQAADNLGDEPTVMDPEFAPFESATTDTTAIANKPTTRGSQLSQMDMMAIEPNLQQQHQLSSSGPTSSACFAQLPVVIKHTARHLPFPAAVFQENLHIIDAFNVPKYEYEGNRKFKRLELNSIFAPAADGKIVVYRERFKIIRQRTLNHEFFLKKKFQLTDLITVKRKEGPVLVLGMLTLGRDNKYILEDLDTSVELEVSEDLKIQGMFTETSIVLCEGVYDDPVFRVNIVLPPPSERRDISVRGLGHLDFFGGPVINKHEMPEIESKLTGSNFVILSEVWLDQPRVMAKLKILFTEFEENLPGAFIFIGSFLSDPFSHGGQDTRKYRSFFNAFAELVGNYPNICARCPFIFVPGPNDPWSGTMALPKPPLPDFLLKKVKEKLKLAQFASNPCRIRVCSKEIVIFRQDSLSKMRRNLILLENERLRLRQKSTNDKENRGSNDNDDTHDNLNDSPSVVPKPDLSSDRSSSKQLIKFLFSQAHLSPLPLFVNPILLPHDQALRLYPLPHMLVLADKCDPFKIEYEGTMCLNPGNFVDTDFSMVVYYPMTGKAEFSKVMAELE